MNIFGDIYLAELKNNKIDKAAVRWMLLNNKDIPVSNDPSYKFTKDFPFNVFSLDICELMKHNSHGCDNRTESMENAVDEDSQLNLKCFGKGKPYFQDINLNFSISHTSWNQMNRNYREMDRSKNDVWGCAISEHEIGFDLQFVRPVKYREISKKYFSALEQDYVREQGMDGFFQLWTRREAIGKAVAEGFFLNDKEFRGSVSKELELLEYIEYKGKNIKIFTKKIAEDLWGSCCII